MAVSFLMPRPLHLLQMVRSRVATELRWSRRAKYFKYVYLLDFTFNFFFRCVMFHDRQLAEADYTDFFGCIDKNFDPRRHGNGLKVIIYGRNN